MSVCPYPHIGHVLRLFFAKKITIAIEADIALAIHICSGTTWMPKIDKTLTNAGYPKSSYTRIVIAPRATIAPVIPNAILRRK